MYSDIYGDFGPAEFGQLDTVEQAVVEDEWSMAPMAPMCPGDPTVTDLLADLEELVLTFGDLSFKAGQHQLIGDHAGLEAAAFTAADLLNRMRARAWQVLDAAYALGLDQNPPF